eukprot:6456796-Amphidinium_carterae.1
MYLVFVVWTVLQDFQAAQQNLLNSELQQAKTTLHLCVVLVRPHALWSAKLFTPTAYQPANEARNYHPTAIHCRINSQNSQT